MVNHYKTYDKLLSRQNLYYILLHSSKCQGKALANNILKQQVFMFFLYQNSLLIGCNNIGW